MVISTVLCIYCLSKGNRKRKKCSTCSTGFHLHCQKKFSKFCCVCKTDLNLKGKDKIVEYKYEPDPPDFTPEEILEQLQILRQLRIDFDLNNQFDMEIELEIEDIL